MGFSGSRSLLGEMVWGWVWEWGHPAHLGLGFWQRFPKPYWLLCSRLTDLPLPAIQCHTILAGTPGIRGSGAPSHGQPSLGPV